MVERVSLAVVWSWCMREFIEHGYRFDIKMTSFGDQRFPVIHVYDNSRAITPFMFTIVLDDGYTKKNPESDDWDFGDRVNVDFQLYYNSFHDEMKKFWVEHTPDTKPNMQNCSSELNAFMPKTKRGLKDYE